MPNHLKNQTSPYLLQHAGNPVDWYPWSAEAFQKANLEDKPIFLSIGYSTCHWCHVMAHESFEDQEIADILNSYFISIKVDKEERPDIDNIYMRVCQTFTGSGGWPTSIFMTAGQKPFFAGTYFPKTTRYGAVGFKELLLAIHQKWESDRTSLLQSGDEVMNALDHSQNFSSQEADSKLLDASIAWYKESFDKEFGGFGDAPKFPTPHNLLFLMQQYSKYGDGETMKMAETTLLQMYAGGLFDHIGYGFCRYSTDRYYLVPHFEKMLYDNALLILAYCKAYDITKKPFYKETAEKTASYVLTEMQSSDGGFYSAQDADSDGEEGKYYVFTPDEITGLLGEQDGEGFNKCFGITSEGNFEGKSIPNLLSTEMIKEEKFDRFLPKLRAYRKNRASLQTDDKILVFWNSLMIAALCALYKSSHNSGYLETAKKTQRFIENKLCSQDTLYVSFRNGRGEKGFLDDYAGYIFALLSLYDVTYEQDYLDRAKKLTEKVIAEYYDTKQGGFYFCGRENETLIFRPKECYDGAIPSGNSLMAYNLVRQNALLPNQKTEAAMQKQLAYLSGEAKAFPAGYAMFLTALSDYLDPPVMITVIRNGDSLDWLPFLVPSGSIVRIFDEETEEYKLLNEQTTFYVCRNHSCLPPVNKMKLMEILKQESFNE